jgi:hypothetical protein
MKMVGWLSVKVSGTAAGLNMGFVGAALALDVFVAVLP